MWELKLSIYKLRFLFQLGICEKINCLMSLRHVQGRGYESPALVHLNG